MKPPRPPSLPLSPEKLLELAQPNRRRIDKINSLVARGVSWWVAIERTGLLRDLEAAAARLESAILRGRVREAYAVAHAARAPRRSLRPRCRAQRRDGCPCEAPVVWSKGAERPAARCRLHGGASTGPRSAEGRARLADGLRARWAAWRAGEGPRPGERPHPPDPPLPPSAPGLVVAPFPSLSKPFQRPSLVRDLVGLGLAAE